MLSLFLFIFKITIAAAVGGFINYIPKVNNTDNIIISSFICIIGASILFLSSPGSNNIGNSVGFAILSVIIITLYICKNKNFQEQFTYIFSAISGMLIGLGYIFQSIVLIILVYNILQNSTKLLNYIYKEDNESNDSKNDDIEN
tara:strand:- start:1 stop:432 length:432 start_codon:yes stop_codon:yes gene_type:complete